MPDTVLDQVGPRLRAARLTRNLTLETLAERAGMSASTLSRLESGKRQANLELLVPLTRALRIGLDDLVPASVPDPRIPQQPYRRDGVEVVPLTPSHAPIHTYRLTYPSASRRPKRRVHDGYEWLYVISGQLRLLLGDRDLVLTAGEAAEFDTRVPHAMCGAGPDGAQVLSIFNEEGARIHTRVKPREPRG